MALRQAGFGTITLYALGALGIAVFVLGIAAKLYKVQRDHARQETVTVKAEYALFVEQVKLTGEQSERDKAKKDQERKEFSHDTAKKLAGRDARIADLERRLRERPPSDPAGRPLSVTGADPGGVQGIGAELVPLADYRALESRALKDAVRIVEVQEYLEGLVKLGVLRWE